MNDAPNPLTDAQVAELDSFGTLLGYMPIPRRAAELWEREIMWGRVTPKPSAFCGPRILYGDGV